MNTQNQTLLPSQKKLLELFLVNAGRKYIGEKFTLRQQAKAQIKHFSFKKIEFCLDISNQELFSLGQQGYLKIFVNPPSIIFNEKTLEHTKFESDNSTKPDGEPPPYSSDPLLLRHALVQFYLWLILSVAAIIGSLTLLTIGIIKVANGSLAITVLSGLSTVVCGFITTIIIKNCDKAYDRVKCIRLQSLTKRK